MRVLSRWIAVGLFALAPRVAMADIISDEEAQCRSQEVGAACTVGEDVGTCQKSTCSRNDYGEGVPPKTKQVDCMVCKPGAAVVEPVADEKDSPAEDTKAATAKGEADKAGSKDEASSKSGGCAMGSTGPAGLGLLLLGGALWMRRRS
ncbi:MAG: hypothetical protein KUG77_00680 [Nannocystaceae bacterium]|nr:hypothetical protein [Nannocystaceae bacterium]